MIIVNPDRFSQQNFPPFIFLCKALSRKEIDYTCVSAKALKDIDSVHIFAKNTKIKPFFSSLRFALFNFLSVIKLIRKKKSSEIIVFRSFDSVLHFLTSRILKKKIVFLVDFLPWEVTFSFKEYLFRPRKLFQVLGLVTADKIIVPTFFLAEQIKTNLPDLAHKVFIEPYSVEIHGNINTESKDKLGHYEIDNYLILASLKTRDEAQVVLRMFAKLENSSLILQAAKDNYILALSHALNLLDRIEFIETDVDLLNLIPGVNLFISEGSGGYIISALNSKVPVVVPDSSQNKELIRSKDFIYLRSNVQSLFEVVNKIKTDKQFVSSFFKDLNLNSEPNWSERVLKVIE